MRATVLGITLAGLLASGLLSAAPPAERAVLRLSVLGTGGQPLDNPTVEVLVRAWGGVQRIRISTVKNEAVVHIDREWLCKAWPGVCSSRVNATILLSAPGYATLSSSSFEWALPADVGHEQPRIWPVVVEFPERPAVKVPHSRTVPLRIELRPLAERTLRLVDAAGASVAGARVTASLFESNENHCASLSAQPLSKSVSDADGVALIADGDFEYSIRIDKDHYYVRNPRDRERDVTPATVFLGRLSRRETKLVLFHCPPRRLRLHVKGRPIAGVHATGCMADCEGGVCSACCGTLGAPDGSGSFLVEDFCPQEWSSFTIVDQKEHELWTADPLSLPNRETVEIDLSSPPP
jgi:hypothetical protein